MSDEEKEPFAENEVPEQQEPAESHSSYKIPESGKGDTRLQLSGMYQGWFLDYASYVIFHQSIGPPLFKHGGRLHSFANALNPDIAIRIEHDLDTAGILKKRLQCRDVAAERPDRTLRDFGGNVIHTAALMESLCISANSVPLPNLAPSCSVRVTPFRC